MAGVWIYILGFLHQQHLFFNNVKAVLDVGKSLHRGQLTLFFICPAIYQDLGQFTKILDNLPRS